MLSRNFFASDPCQVARALLGKIIKHKFQGTWLCARIIETEAYYLTDKASHASLGYTEKRKALFMAPGTIYMYYARGGDSLNVSCEGDGNAVLIKSGIPCPLTDFEMLRMMHQNNPKRDQSMRDTEKLCSGQTLLCKSLGLKVKEWDKGQFHPQKFKIESDGYEPKRIVQAKRLGIPIGRDEHLPYRFIDEDFVSWCTRKPQN